MNNKIEIDLICVGKLKTDILTELENNLLKDIYPKYNIHVIEIPDEKNLNINRQAEVEKIKNIEGDRIISKIKKGSYIITFEIEKQQLRDQKFYEFVDNLEKSHITIVIGGSVGLSSKVSDLSNKKISLSKMTFPHQLVRILIIEQFTKTIRKQ